MQESYEMNIFVLCGIFLLPLIFGLAIYAFIRYIKLKWEKRFLELAAATQFQYLPSSQNAPYRRRGMSRGSPVLLGRIDHFSCLIWLYESRSARSTMNNPNMGTLRHYTKLEVHLPLSLNLGLKIEPELSSLTSLFDLFTGDIQINDEVFDKMFRIKAHDPNAVYQFLTPQRKMTLYNAQQSISQLGALHITDTMVEAEMHGGKLSPDEIIFVMKQLVAVAHQVSSLPLQR